MQLLLLFLPALYYLWFFLFHPLRGSGSGLLAVVVILAAMIPLFLSRQEKPHPLWFKAHKFGYGWYPATWQGCCLLTIMLVLAIFVGYLVNNQSYSVSDMLISAFPFWFLILTTFFAIVHRTGEKGKWRWGEKKRK